MASLRCLLSKRHIIAGKVVTNGLVTCNAPSIFPAVTASIIAPPQLINNNHNQVRCKVTKTKKRQALKMVEREKRVAKGLPAKPKPPKYIAKDTTVINAMTREERDDESKKFDVAAAEEMKMKITEQNDNEENLRFQFDGLVMSDRVRKLFGLKNGSQGEVVTSQKRRGMEVSCVVHKMLSICYSDYHVCILIAMKLTRKL